MMSKQSESLQRLIDLLKDNLDHIETVTSSRWSNSHWQIIRPLENLFEIDYTLSGTLNMCYGNNEVVCNPGDVFMWDGINPGSCEAGQFTYCYIMFKVRADYGNKDELISALHKCFEDITRIRCPLDKIHSIEQLFLDSSIEMLAEQNNFQLVTQISLITLLVQIQRIAAAGGVASSLVTSDKYMELIGDIIKYLSNRLGQSITLTELGTYYQLNPEYLNRIFKRITGYTIIHYFLRMKIEKAKQLLRLTKMNQVDIALEVGMGSSQYFSYMFKRIVGVTPSNYRKRWDV